MKKEVKEVIWHPRLYERYVGNLRFVFLSTYLFTNFRDALDASIENWGLRKYSRAILIGPTDIFLRFHHPETGPEQPSITDYLNRLLGGLGEVNVSGHPKPATTGQVKIRHLR